jgi:toxin ParE1/3/4
MSRCRFSSTARRDLQGIHDYIAVDDPAAALRWIDRIEETCRLLGENPQIGESCDELSAGLRMISEGNYIIFFRPAVDGAEIARIIHGARDWRRLL